MSSNKRQTAAITTLGCKVNQYESASFVSQFEAHGIKIVPFNKEADIYVINSCAVTGKAGAQSRQMIRRALRKNPDARVVVTGCYAQIASKDIADFVDQPICIVGNDNKHLLVDIALATELSDVEVYMGDISQKKEISYLPIHRFHGRTRAYLKIQDGCDNFCSYCIVPYARGQVRSLDLERALSQIGVFAREGYLELVLTGINIGKYGRDLTSKISLLDLLRLIDAQKSPMRFRISSLDPGAIDDELLRLIAGSEKFMPHFHLPLQSGDSSILKRMNRKYSPEQFVGVVEKILAVMPEAAIGIDVLVGFPGEDDAMFMSTVALVEKLPISYLHVFPFSKRPGTPAAEMPDQVPVKVKDERVALLKELDHKKRTAFYNRQLGTVHQVLAENDSNQFQMVKGYTENYVPVFFAAPATVMNRLVRVEIDRVMDLNVFGTLV